VLEVIVNGKSRSLQGPVSVRELVQEMALLDKRIAVEVNGEIVPASQHSTYQLSNGDSIEIVGAIGGG